MTRSTCSPACGEAHRDTSRPERQLRVRMWLGFAAIACSCGLAYLAYTFTAWFWIPCALLGWYGSYQTVYSKGCGRTAGGADASEAETLTVSQRVRRYRLGHGFLAGTVVLAVMSAGVLPALWPLAVIAGWFAASFYVAARTGYVGCPEVGAIPSLLLGRRIATRCAPLEKMDFRSS